MRGVHCSNTMPKRTGRGEGPLRRFAGAVLWLVRSGAHWRASPLTRSNWRTTHTRFAQWTKSKAWGWSLAAVQARNVGLGTLLLDPTAVRAHQHAAGV